MSKSIYVYHEKQVGSLCGKHCMNSLLQEVDLMRFAQELDESERQIMAEKGTETKEFLEYMRNDSENISDDGNFSIQVLTRALNTKGLEVAPFSRALLTSSFMNTVGAFLVNQGKHWIAIRKVNGKWYNCNSFLPRPSFMSDFYLSSYLEGILNDGFDIYFVKGAFPSALPYQRTGSEDGQWVLMEGDEENDLKLALRESLEIAKPGVTEKDESPLIDHRQSTSPNKVFQNPLEISMLRKSEVTKMNDVATVKDPFEQWIHEDIVVTNIGQDPIPATSNIQIMTETNSSLNKLMETMDTFVGRLESAEKKLSALEKSWNLIAR